MEGECEDVRGKLKRASDRASRVRFEVSVLFTRGKALELLPGQ